MATPWWHGAVARLSCRPGPAFSLDRAQPGPGSARAEVSLAMPVWKAGHASVKRLGQLRPGRPGPVAVSRAAASGTSGLFTVGAILHPVCPSESATAVTCQGAARRRFAAAAAAHGAAQKPCRAATRPAPTPQTLTIWKVGMWHRDDASLMVPRLPWLSSLSSTMIQQHVHPKLAFQVQTLTI